MKRRPCVFAAVCALCAQLTVMYLAAWLEMMVFAAVVLEVILLIYVITGGAWKYMLCPVIFLTFLLIFPNRFQNTSPTEAEAQQFCDACAAQGLMGKISRIEKKTEQWYLYIAVTKDTDEGYSGGLLAIVDTLPEQFMPGCVVLVKGRTELIGAATNPGQFDARSYYLAQGYIFRSFSPEVQLLKAADPFNQFLQRIKCSMECVLEEISCEQDFGVYDALLLGNRSELDEETKTLFQTGGISHILAISGLHISFIGTLLYGLLRKAGQPVALASSVSSIVLVCYTLLTGNSVTTQRACIMMLLSFGAGCLGRTPDMLSSMSLAWILISIRYPWQITQAGCQLSFAAIIALGILLPVWEKNLEYQKKKGEGVRIKVFRRICSGVLGAAAIQFVTWPILAWHYFQISVYSLFLNMLVLPLTGVLLFSLLLAVLIGMLCGGAGGGMCLAGFIIFPAHLVMAFYRKLCMFCAFLPGHICITGQPRWWQMLLYTGILGGVTLLLLVRGRRREAAAEQNVSSFDHRTGRLRSVVWEYVTAFAVLLMLLTGGLHLLVRVKGRELTVVFMDVGQGDGIFLQSGGFSLFIDGGSTSVSNVGIYRIKPLLLYYGVTNVDAWFLTHPDQDHISGFMELLEKSGENGTPRIGGVIVAAAGCEASEWFAVNEALLKGNIPRMLIEQGGGLRAGELSLECLYPQKSEIFTETNDLCIVLRAEYGNASMLLTGDIGIEAEELLCVRYADNPRKLSCDLLKVAHHGSRYSSSECFLEMTGAAYAVISCGKNTYGHPAAEVIARLKAEGMEIHITKEEGAVVITVDGDV